MKEILNVFVFVEECFCCGNAKPLTYQINQHFINKDPCYSPLIYCWRGGQRSQSLGFILDQIGWAVTVLKGGYKSYRYE